jgi:hypothetical protein
MTGIDNSFTLSWLFEEMGAGSHCVGDQGFVIFLREAVEIE